MVFQKKARLLVLFLLALVCAIAFQILQISKTENLHPMSVLDKGIDFKKIQNVFPVA